jgi:hypothetical protein
MYLQTFLEVELVVLRANALAVLVVTAKLPFFPF